MRGIVSGGLGRPSVVSKGQEPAGSRPGRDHRSLSQRQASRAAASTDAQAREPPQYLAIATALANDRAADGAGSLRAGREGVHESNKQKIQHALPKEESQGEARREIQEAQVEEVRQGAGAREEEVVVKASPSLRIPL